MDKSLNRTRRFLKKAWAAGRQQVAIVTGRGKHSEDQDPKIKHEVEKLLDRKKYKWYFSERGHRWRENSGCIVVELQSAMDIALTRGWQKGLRKGRLRILSNWIWDYESKGRRVGNHRIPEAREEARQQSSSPSDRMRGQQAPQRRSSSWERNSLSARTRKLQVWVSRRCKQWAYSGFARLTQHIFEDILSSDKLITVISNVYPLLHNV